MKAIVIAIVLLNTLAIGVTAQVKSLNFPHPFRIKDTSVFGTTIETYELWSVGGEGDLFVRTGTGDQRRAISRADLTALLFVNERSVFIVGTEGEILYSNDRGKAWQKQVSHTKTNLTSIDCVDEYKCWIVGSKDGLLLRGGASTGWTQSKIVSDGKLTDVDFVNGTVGYAVGWNGILLKTEDGGDRWVRISVPSTIEVNQFMDGVPNYEAVVFESATTGCLAGWDIGTGFAACTRDGGRTWTTANVKAHPVGIVWGKDGRVFIMDEYGDNLVSNDLGKSWRPHE